MKIIIKGDFTIEAPIPALDMMCKRFSYIELETRNIPSVVVNQMSGIIDKTENLEEGK